MHGLALKSGEDRPKFTANMTLPPQGSVKVDWLEGDPSPTALRSPLSPRERTVIFDFLSLSGGRGGTAKRWVRGPFADDAFEALEVIGTLDFDGALPAPLPGLANPLKIRLPGRPSPARVDFS